MNAGASEDGSFFMIPPSESDENWIMQQIWICYEKQRAIGKVEGRQDVKKDEFLDLPLREKIYNIIMKRKEECPDTNIIVSTMFCLMKEMELNKK